MLGLTRWSILWSPSPWRCPPLADRGSARWVNESPERVHRLSPICTPFEYTSLTNALKCLSLRATKGPVLSQVEGCVAIRHAVSLRGEAEAIPEIPRSARNDLSGQIASFHSQRRLLSLF